MKRVICGVTDDGAHAVLIDGATREAPRLDIVWLAKQASMVTADLTFALDDYDFYPAMGEIVFVGHQVPPGSATDMHRTPYQIQFVTVVSGSCELDMGDGSSAHLEAGDAIVQLGAFHRWRNEGTEPCRLTTVGIGIEPDKPGLEGRLTSD